MARGPASTHALLSVTPRHGDSLATAHTRMSDDEAITLAHNLYGMEGSVQRFATEKDDTFKLETSQGPCCILKIAHPLEDSAEIDLQVHLLQHIEAVDATLPVPRMAADLHGRLWSQITDLAGQRRAVRMMSYLEGTPLDKTSCCASQREQIGELLARLRLATSTFSHPADTRILAWDVKHLLQLAPLLNDIDDVAKRQQLTMGLRRFESYQEQLLHLRSQVLHNDFSKSNIVVDHSRMAFVTGVIDFGDAVRTAVAVDVSTALLNQLPRNAAQLLADDLFADGRDLLTEVLRYGEGRLAALEASGAWVPGERARAVPV